MTLRSSFLTCSFCVSLVLVGSCSRAATPEPEPALAKTYYIPAENEEYAPRDIQAKVQIEQAYLDNLPALQSMDALSGLVFNVDWKSMAPTQAGPWDSRTAATVALSIVPDTVLSGRLDPSRSDYSSYKGFSNSPVVGREFGLARRTNNRQSRPGGPIDELFTLEDGKFDFLIDCYDPGNEQRRTCAMYMLTKPTGELAHSAFVLQISVAFHRSALPHWREIQSKVGAFVRQRTAFVPFQSGR